jgi:Mycotoxin biosynthesis protein UstYa
MNDSRYSNEEMFKDQDNYDRILEQWSKDMPSKSHGSSKYCVVHWLTVRLTVGRGFVAVSDEDSKMLKRPYHLRDHPERNGYSIASLHQFHCIYMIMRGMGDHIFNRPSHDPDMERHITHCFDYLRQSAQCAGDAALEGMSTSVDRMTDGWGNTHVCKKNNELVQWVIDNRLSDNIGIH